MSIDPTATIQEESINLVAEIELQERVFYIKATTQVFTALEGGYLDFGGGMGLNTTLAVFEPEIKDIHWNDAVNGNFKKKNKKDWEKSKEFDEIKPTVEDFIDIQLKYISTEKLGNRKIG